MSYTPTPEHLAALGYAPDAAHDVPGAHLAGYSQQAPAPLHPWYATLVVQVRLPTFEGPHRGFWLTRYASKSEIMWNGYEAANPLFFEQLLQVLGWPVGPALPEPAPEASAELMLLRYIAYHPAKAYERQQELANHPASNMQWLYEKELINVIQPVPGHLRGPGLLGTEIRARPGLIELTPLGLDYLQQRRHYRETPKNFPFTITQTTHEPRN